jgi:hypothetical protein
LYLQSKYASVLGLAAEIREPAVICVGHRHVSLSTRAVLAASILHAAAKRGLVTPVKRGLYNLVPFELGSATFHLDNRYVLVRESLGDKPYFFSYASALDIHGLATQPSFDVYVKYSVRRKVNQLSRYPLSEREALRAFEALRRTPEFFRRYLQRYLAYAELGSRAALDDTLAHVFNDSGYRTAWVRLLPADKAVLRALAQGISDLHSLPARERLGSKPVAARSVRRRPPTLAQPRAETREARHRYPVSERSQQRRGHHTAPRPPRPPRCWTSVVHLRRVG